MATLVEKYVEGLKKAYLKNNAATEWRHFESVKHGAKKADLLKIKKEYPNVPDALIDLLEYVDGTYCLEYKGEEIDFYILGSDVEDYGYPYYLLASTQILEEAESAIEHRYGLDDFLDWINENGYFELYDDKLTDNPDKAKWLCFSQCINGEDSELYIDFTPSEKGKIGQVVRYLHDPDQYKVIADSFEDYLKMIIEHEYAFITEDIMEL